MNILFTFLTLALLLIGRTNSAPLDAADGFDFTTEAFITTPEPTTTTTGTTTTTITTTTTTGTTTTTITTTTTTTTLAPEVDREWEDLVLAGPTVVNYLGLFMILASRSDQILVPSAEYTIKYIQNVQSLRAVLSQISSAMQAAFQVARADLVRTRTSMEQIPDHIKAGLLLIQTAPKDLLSKLLPYTIRNVDRAANEGSEVTKPTLDRFTSVGQILEELVTLLGSTPSTAENADYLIEANAYAADIAKQWDLLGKLFKKFSDRADLTKRSISNSFIGPIEVAQQADGFNIQNDRTTQLEKLIPATIAIDQSSNLLDLMARTYTDISNEHMLSQIASSNTYLGLAPESVRVIKERQLWQNTVAQSIKVARLAQERQNQFAETSPGRQAEYATYLQGVLAA